MRTQWVNVSSSCNVYNRWKWTRQPEFKNLDKAVFISHSVNILGNGRNSAILPPAISKQNGRLDALSLVWQPVWEKENSEFKPVSHCLKRDRVSPPVRAEGLGKYTDESYFISLNHCVYLFVYKLLEKRCILAWTLLWLRTPRFTKPLTWNWLKIDLAAALWVLLEYPNLEDLPVMHKLLQLSPLFFLLFQNQIRDRKKKNHLLLEGLSSIARL